MQTPSAPKPDETSTSRCVRSLFAMTYNVSRGLYKIELHCSFSRVEDSCRFVFTRMMLYQALSGLERHGRFSKRLRSRPATWLNLQTRVQKQRTGRHR